MKLKNIFKKSTETVAATNVQKLEKKQLEKVIGGAEEKVVEKATSGLKDTLKTQV